MSHYQVYAKYYIKKKGEDKKIMGKKVTHETQIADKCSHGANENYDQNSLRHQKYILDK